MVREWWHYLGPTFAFVITTLGQQALPRYAVLPMQAAKPIGFHGTWKPTLEDVAGAEASLAQVSGMTPIGWPSVIHVDHPESYFRQYLPVRQGNRKLIYVNAFCDQRPPIDWRTRLFVVIDGATCYWQALYDPSTKMYSHLTINARA